MLLDSYNSVIFLHSCFFLGGFSVIYLFFSESLLFKVVCSFHFFKHSPFLIFFSLVFLYIYTFLQFNFLFHVYVIPIFFFFSTLDVSLFPLFIAPNLSVPLQSVKMEGFNPLASAKELKPNNLIVSVDTFGPSDTLAEASDLIFNCLNTFLTDVNAYARIQQCVTPEDILRLKKGLNPQFVAYLQTLEPAWDHSILTNKYNLF